MTAGKLLQKARACIGGDIAGSFVNARRVLEELDPPEQEAFLLLVKTLMEHKVRDSIDEYFRILARDFDLFKRFTP